MAEPIQPAAAAAALEPVPVRILVVIVVDILVATVADTGVVVLANGDKWEKEIAKNLQSESLYR